MPKIGGAGAFRRHTKSLLPIKAPPWRSRSSHGRMSARCFFPALGIKARPKPKLRDRKSLTLQDTIGRTQEIEVEEVETVETVEATGEDRDSMAAVSLPA
jgi:hypothetical protein